VRILQCIEKVVLKSVTSSVRHPVAWSKFIVWKLIFGKVVKISHFLCKQGIHSVDTVAHHCLLILSQMNQVYVLKVYINNILQVMLRCEPGSSVSAVSEYGLDGQGSIPDRGNGFSL
jgi:hypothetical protein